MTTVPARPARMASRRPTNERRRRVLLVEDDPGDALLFTDALSVADPDLCVVHVGDLDGAAREIAQAPPDCVVLDLGLPGSRDLEALDAIRTLAPDVAAVVLTGWGDDAVGMAAVAAGAQDYLVKGEASGPTIARSIRFAVERRHTQRAAAALLRAELERIEQERLERALLGTPRLDRPDLTWHSRYTAARSGVISGDFIDCVQLPDGTVRAVVGDVSGHRSDDAALGVALRAGWRALVLDARDPGGEVLGALELLLVSERLEPDAFATVCDVTIAPDLRTVVVRSAGHPPPVLLGESAPVQLIDASGTSPLGVPFGPRRWPGTAVALPDAWSLALYTDGLFEVRDRAGTILSVDEVPDAVGRVAEGRRVVADHLLADFAARSDEGWRDDVAVAVVARAA